jgi:sugar (pentulose or hexulose) kinase
VNESLYLAIDAGTTVVKAALVASNGLILEMTNCRLGMDAPRDSWCEMDMDSVWQAVCRVLQQLRESNMNRWANIAAVGICAQGDGLWPIDQNGVPVRPAILWNDTRAASLLDYDEINLLALEHASSPLFTGAAPVLLRWMKEYEPENYRLTAHALHCKDWLNYRLTEVIATDETDASTALLNIHSKQYEFPLLSALNITETECCYPKVYLSPDVIGEVTGKAELETGIRKGVPVIAGTIDVLAAAAGCGVLEPGQRGSILGTTLCSYVVLDEAGAKEHAGINGSVLCHNKSGAFIRLMAALSGISSLDWAQREIFGGESFRELESAIAAIPVGSGGVLFHPYLFGERAPFRIPAASGAFFGLRSGHTKYHMGRAAFEGMALSLYDCYRSLPAGTSGIIVAGGAAKSNFVCQIVSDCMGVRITRNRQQELGIAGVIRLLCKRFDLIPETTEAQDHFEPDSACHTKYEELYTVFVALQQAMRPFWEQV